MSYARKGHDGSDVYMYRTTSLDEEPSPNGPIVCSECALQPSGDYLAYSHRAALEHLLDHSNAGHSVPEAAITRLKRESSEPT
jgi:hypothetical protein